MISLISRGRNSLIISWCCIPCSTCCSPYCSSRSLFSTLPLYVYITFNLSYTFFVCLTTMYHSSPTSAVWINLYIVFNLTSNIFSLHRYVSEIKFYFLFAPREVPGGLSRECVLRIPSVIVELSWIGCLTSQLTIFQSYMWRHIDVQADWRRSWTYGRAPNAIDISQGFLTCPS